MTGTARIIAHKPHADLPGTWRVRKLRYGSFSLEVELPCINGLAAWFSVATFHEAGDDERLITDGARQEAGEYAAKFAALATWMGQVASERARLFRTCLRTGGSPMTTTQKAAEAARRIAEQRRSIVNLDLFQQDAVVLADYLRSLPSARVGEVDEFVARAERDVLLEELACWKSTPPSPKEG